ncbi:Npun_F5749 family FMN-dependent PPOX-type flavoprotein [Calothrix rhizosoleniae]|uniref:Npun_F5749 family FMN-dependent PPOX-type flavoprotein n=1 Tax=Calothrix rhizosoleniae TaxID=888997 RepID=UPI000B49A36F|nr:Npun_F5749 family FMN-dependent PPOX-type flavoprotein [Calothrix rhizosoleniae]
MSLAPWRSLISRALHLNRSLVYARYFQLATVKKNGRPANRTVVFRGFWGETNKLKIITDSRSQKFTEIQEQSGGEICWYFPKTREQFRLSGEITLIGCNNYGQDFQQARQSTWQEISDNARVQFAWAHPREKRANFQTFSPPPPDPIVPLDNFCLLLFEPLQVDHLQLRGEPQNRWLYSQNELGDWETLEVNP